MGRYATETQTAAGTNLTILMLIGAAAVRPKWYDFILGSDATPADVATEFSIARTTAAGTGGTGLTEEPLDPLTVAASATGIGGTFSGEPTYGNRLMNVALNQRATFRWVAAPEGELVTTATAANGIACRSIASGGTPNVNMSVFWSE